MIKSIHSFSLEIRDVDLCLTRGRGRLESSQQVLSKLSITINEPEIVAILGPNGVGKSTLLRLIAGLTFPDSGGVWINGRKPNESRIGIMFQNYRETLFPWFSGQKNLEIARAKSRDDSDVQQRRVFVNAILGNDFPLHARPSTLSGGQQQRLCLARSISCQSDVLLLDEPYSAIDYRSKIKCQRIMHECVRESRVTTLVVTHDTHDAIVLADRILVCVGSPLRIADDIPVPMPHPRSYEMFEDKASHCWDIVSRISKSLRDSLQDQ